MLRVCLLLSQVVPSPLLARDRGVIPWRRHGNLSIYLSPSSFSGIEFLISSLFGSSPLPFLVSAMSASPRTYLLDTFSPVGLHVLLVDDDPLCLMILDTMLRKCQYRVTACNHASTALQLVREGPKKFDLVLSDVCMPDVDGFELLKIVGLEMDLPVIMMSANGDTNVVMKGIMHGACDYLIKPVRMAELKIIWQHVIRRNGSVSPELESRNDIAKFSELESFPKKQKIAEDFLESPLAERNTCKKARVNWTFQLHQKFLNAVNEVGVERAVPKKLLEIMNVHGLTREHIASHLQKYRLYLKQLTGAVPEPCPIASFQASTDGMSGTMCIIPGGKISNSKPTVKGLKLGIDMAGSIKSREGKIAAAMNSQAQVKASEQVYMEKYASDQIINELAIGNHPSAANIWQEEPYVCLRSYNTK